MFPPRQILVQGQWGWKLKMCNTLILVFSGWWLGSNDTTFSEILMRKSSLNCPSEGHKNRIVTSKGGWPPPIPGANYALGWIRGNNKLPWQEWNSSSPFTHFVLLLLVIQCISGRYIWRQSLQTFKASQNQLAVTQITTLLVQLPLSFNLDRDR